MTAAKPVDDITKAVAGYWNSNPVSASNPGGLDESDDGLTAGHVDNFPAAVGAVGRMTQWVGEQADLAGQAAASVASAAASAQSAAAVAAAAAGNTVWGGLATGSANALAVVPAVTVSALFDGLTLRFVAAASNTGGVTLKVGALPVKPLCDPSGTAITPGALSTNLVTTATYIAASDQWRLGGAGGGVTRAQLHAAPFAF